MVLKLENEDYVGVKQQNREWKSISNRGNQVAKGCRAGKRLGHLRKR